MPLSIRFLQTPAAPADRLDEAVEQLWKHASHESCWGATRDRLPGFSWSSAGVAEEKDTTAVQPNTLIAANRKNTVANVSCTRPAR